MNKASSDIAPNQVVIRSVSRKSVLEAERQCMMDKRFERGEF